MAVKRFDKIVAFFGFCFLLLAGFILYKKGSGGKRIGDHPSGHFIIFAAPSVAEQAADVARAYSSHGGVKVSINYVGEAELGTALSELDSPDHPIGFIGYEPKNKEADSFVSVGQNRIIGVSTVDFGSLASPSSDVKNGEVFGKSFVFKNLCQLEHVATRHGVPIFLSSTSKHMQSIVEEIYGNDCDSLCLGLQQKIVGLTDISVLNFVEENKEDYILVGKGVVSRLLADRVFDYKEAMGLFFHFYNKFAPSGIVGNKSSSAYQLIEIVNDNKLNIVVEDPMDLDEIKTTVLEACKEEMRNAGFVSGFILPSEAARRKVVLIGPRKDIENYGNKVYQTPRSGNVWFYCQDPSNKICADFQYFLSSRKARAIAKKYE